MQSKHPIIGLDHDTDDGNLQPGWCREIWNVLPKNGYSKTSIQNALGTAVRTNGSLAAGTNTCIGAFTDKSNNRVFYFLYNSNNNHSIWYFDPNTNTHTLVLQTPYHNFSLSYPIRSCDFIEGIMEYTDGNNQVRSLIVSQAVAGLYTFTSQAKFEQQISLHKVRPELPPTSVRTIGTSGFNSITQDSYQFCFQFVFKDNSISRISPLSLLNPADAFPNNTNTNNLINVTVKETLSVGGIIKKIYFLYMKNGDGNYWLFKEGSPNSADVDYIGSPSISGTHISWTIPFYGNESVQQIVVNNVNQIPSKSNNLMIHNQRSYLTLNEFDYPAWTGGTLSATKATPSVSTLTTKRLFLPNSSSTIGIIFYDEFGRTPGVDKEATVVFSGVNKGYPGPGLSGTEQLAMNWSITGTPPSWAKTYAVVLKKSNSFESVFSCLALPMFYIGEQVNAPTASQFSDSSKLFQESAPTVWTSGVYWKMPLNLPFVVDGQYKLRLLNNLTGADYYVEDIVAIHGDQIITSGDFGVSNWSVALNGTTYGMVWVQLELYKKDQDEVFFEIGKNFDCSSGSFSVTSGQILGEYHYTPAKLVYKPFDGGDCSYLSQRADGFAPYFFENTNFNFKGTPIRQSVISKSPTNSSITLETTQTTDTPRNSTSQLLDDAVSAAGTIFPGWVGLAKATHTDFIGNVAGTIDKKNPFGATVTATVNQVYTVDYNKACSDFGRICVNVKNKKTSFEPNSIAISDPYVINSKINGLFDYQIIFQMPISRTPITKLVNLSGSNIFLAVHQRRTTSLATYSGDNILHTTSGTQLLGDGKSIIGYDNELAGDYGSLYYDSVITHKGKAYFFDPYSGEVLRYANNGLTPLASSYKMKTFFRTKGNQFIDATGRNVIAGYDGNLDILYLTFRSTTPSEEVTVAFIDRQGEERWFCLTDFLPERYAQINDRLFGFMNGVMWEFNANNTRNLFFGTQYKSKVKHLFNPAYSHEKMLMNVGVESNKPWDFTSIYVNKIGVDQETTLAKSNFTKRDDLYYADVKRDKNTATGLLPAGKSALVAGQPMIGKVYEITLENDDTELVELDYLNYGYIPQAGHNII